ncbi:hypothetical protein SUGI_0702820 [Cryptomeria japonica]|nr:hypothetical protein SUGI_0702820 [Cryptomeria japonica]
MASVNAPISKDYELKIVNTEVIVPTLPMQQHILPLSNLDLLIPPFSVHVFFCYKNPFPRTFASALSHLKTSLSKVHCNNKGVRFTQAYAAAPLSQLNLYDPDESVQGKLVPLLSKPFQEDGIPVFSVQVTEFGCGGLVIGCTFDHRIADAYSANMFLTRLIHDAIKSAANEEPFQSLIDFVETTKPTPVLAKIYFGAEDMESSGPAVLVSSGPWFPLYEVDFGWGKPTFVSYHFPWGAEAGYVMPTHSPAGDGSWIVYMHLPMEQLSEIESDPNRILLPITQDFLHLA